MTPKSENKKPTVGAVGSEEQKSKSTNSDSTPLALGPECLAVVERYNEAVLAINDGEAVCPQLNEYDGLEFTVHRGKLQIFDRGVWYSITTRRDWHVWRAPGFTREAFLRNQLKAGDVLAVKNKGTVL